MLNNFLKIIKSKENGVNLKEFIRLINKNKTLFQLIENYEYISDKDIKIAAEIFQQIIKSSADCKKFLYFFKSLDFSADDNLNLINELIILALMKLLKIHRVNELKKTCRQQKDILRNKMSVVLQFIPAECGMCLPKENSDGFLTILTLRLSGETDNIQKLKKTNFKLYSNIKNFELMKDAHQATDQLERILYEKFEYISANSVTFYDRSDDIKLVKFKQNLKSIKETLRFYQIIEPNFFRKITTILHTPSPTTKIFIPPPQDNSTPVPQKKFLSTIKYGFNKLIKWIRNHPWQTFGVFLLGAAGVALTASGILSPLGGVALTSAAAIAANGAVGLGAGLVLIGGAKISGKLIKHCRLKSSVKAEEPPAPAVIVRPTPRPKPRTEAAKAIVSRTLAVTADVKQSIDQLNSQLDPLVHALQEKKPDVRSEPPTPENLSSALLNILRA